jgi:hypothetical protein
MQIEPSSLLRVATSPTPCNQMALQRTFAAASITSSRSCEVPSLLTSSNARAMTQRTRLRTPSRFFRALSGRENSSILGCQRSVPPLCAGPTRPRPKWLQWRSRSARGRIRRKPRTVSYPTIPWVCGAAEHSSTWFCSNRNLCRARYCGHWILVRLSRDPYSMFTRFSLTSTDRLGVASSQARSRNLMTLKVLWFWLFVYA